MIVTTPTIVIRAARVADAAAIAAIWNHEVQHTEATTDTVVRGVAAHRAWLVERDDDHPVIVADCAGDVAGYAALSAYRPKPAFRRSVEDSVYVARGVRGRGIGARLLARLVELARERGHHSIIARITSRNAASLKLHERLGFETVGIEREIAFKLGRWLDVVVMQRLV